jgi:hypothetical protein
LDLIAGSATSAALGTSLAASFCASEFKLSATCYSPSGEKALLGQIVSKAKLPDGSHFKDSRWG